VTSDRFGWRLRRGFWNGLAVLKFHGQKAALIPPGTADPRPVQLVPFASRYPDIPIDGVVVADHIPSDESDTPKRLFTRFQHRLVQRYSPMREGLPSIPTDADAALTHAYTPAHRRCFPTPERPREHGLGAMAVASPYASYLEATGDGSFRWDLTSLADVDCHPGLVELGAVVDFQIDDGSGELAPIHIETALGAEKPGTPGWDDAVRMATCSITTHASMVRHFNWLHLTAGPALEAVTRNELPAHHPVRRLLWAHVYGTHGGNDLVTEIIMSKGGEFDSIFSLTHRGICELFEATTGDLDLAAINPVLDAARRGVAELGIATPAHANWSGLYQVFLAHAQRYLELYYPSEDDLANDQALGAWLEELDRRLPHGVRSVLGAGVTMPGLAALLATIVYLTTVEHEITGSGLWDYQLWADTSPVRVYADGRGVPVDVYQRLVNANFNLNVHRTMLLDDALVGLAVDAAGARAFQELQQDLLGFQAQLDRTSPAPWRMEPRFLKANINA
jgi:hypothetical protein